MPHGDITHIEIPVRDRAAASGFYSKLFGWEIATSPGFEDYPMWRAPNQVSGGALVARDSDGAQPLSYVEVDSIDDTVAAAVEAGGAVVREKGEIDPTSWWAVITDPDGNRIGLYEGSTEV